MLFCGQCLVNNTTGIPTDNIFPSLIPLNFKFYGFLCLVCMTLAINIIVGVVLVTKCVMDSCQRRARLCCIFTVKGMLNKNTLGIKKCETNQKQHCKKVCKIEPHNHNEYPLLYKEAEILMSILGRFLECRKWKCQLKMF